MMPTEIAEQIIKNSCPEYDDLNVQEVLVMQESAYQYIEEIKQKETILIGETSNRVELDRQLALDEELAIALESDEVDQLLAMDEDFAKALVLEEGLHHEHDVQAAEVTDSTSQGTSSRGVEDDDPRPDDIDPDTMTYEELQTVGESVGNECRGLSAELIDRLPIFEHKNKNPTCVICCSEYENGDKKTPLPCFHTFHSTCITEWLQRSKQCPICQNEVQIE